MSAPTNSHGASSSRIFQAASNMLLSYASRANAAWPLSRRPRCAHPASTPPACRASDDDLVSLALLAAQERLRFVVADDRLGLGIPLEVPPQPHRDVRQVAGADRP